MKKNKKHYRGSSRLKSSNIIVPSATTSQTGFRWTSSKMMKYSFAGARDATVKGGGVESFKPGFQLPERC